MRAAFTSSYVQATGVERLVCKVQHVFGAVKLVLDLTRFMGISLPAVTSDSNKANVAPRVATPV